MIDRIFDLLEWLDSESMNLCSISFSSLYFVLFWLFYSVFSIFIATVVYLLFVYHSWKCLENVKLPASHSPNSLSF